MEGPSLVILRQELKPFIGKKVLRVSGYSTIGIKAFEGQQLKWAKTWGKHLILKIGNITFRTHFLLFGTYLINQQKDRKATLTLEFENGDVHFYSAAIRLIEEPLDTIYDWRVDVMSRRWDSSYVFQLVQAKPAAYVCDVLLDQQIFAGVGNIIKCEVLFNLKLPPLTKVSSLTMRELKAVVEEAHRYSHQFYKWKKKFVLRKHWRIYRKHVCPLTGDKVAAEEMGKTKRYTYYCPTCQAKAKKIKKKK